MSACKTPSKRKFAIRVAYFTRAAGHMFPAVRSANWAFRSLLTRIRGRCNGHYHIRDAINSSTGKDTAQRRDGLNARSDANDATTSTEKGSGVWIARFGTSRSRIGRRNGKLTSAAEGARAHRAGVSTPVLCGAVRAVYSYGSKHWDKADPYLATYDLCDAILVALPPEHFNLRYPFFIPRDQTWPNDDPSRL